MPFSFSRIADRLKRRREQGKSDALRALEARPSGDYDAHDSLDARFTYEKMAEPELYEPPDDLYGMSLRLRSAGDREDIRRRYADQDNDADRAPELPDPDESSAPSRKSAMPSFFSRVADRLKRRRDEGEGDALRALETRVTYDRMSGPDRGDYGYDGESRPALGDGAIPTHFADRGDDPELPPGTSPRGALGIGHSENADGGGAGASRSDLVNALWEWRLSTDDEEPFLRAKLKAMAGGDRDMEARIEGALNEIATSSDDLANAGLDYWHETHYDEVAADFILSGRPQSDRDTSGLKYALADTADSLRAHGDAEMEFQMEEAEEYELRHRAGNNNLNPLGDDDLGEAPARRPAAGVDDTGSANLDPIGNDDLGAPPLRQDNGEDDAGSQNLNPLRDDDLGAAPPRPDDRNEDDAGRNNLDPIGGDDLGAPPLRQDNGEDDAGSQNLNPLRDDDLGAAPPRPDDRNEDDAGRNNLDPIGGDDLGAPLLRRYDGDDAGVGSSNLTPVSENALGEASARPAMDADPEDGDLGRPPSQYQRERERWERAMRERMMTGENGGEADPEDGDLGRPPSQYQRERERWERAMRERMMTGENGGEASPQDDAKLGELGNELSAAYDKLDEAAQRGELDGDRYDELAARHSDLFERYQDGEDLEADELDRMLRDVAALRRDLDEGSDRDGAQPSDSEPAGPPPDLSNSPGPSDPESGTPPDPFDSPEAPEPTDRAAGDLFAAEETPPDNRRPDDDPARIDLDFSDIDPGKEVKDAVGLDSPDSADLISSEAPEPSPVDNEYRREVRDEFKKMVRKDIAKMPDDVKNELEIQTDLLLQSAGPDGAGDSDSQEDLSPREIKRAKKRLKEDLADRYERMLAEQSLPKDILALRSGAFPKSKSSAAGLDDDTATGNIAPVDPDPFDLTTTGPGAEAVRGLKKGAAAGNVYDDGDLLNVSMEEPAGDRKSGTSKQDEMILRIQREMRGDNPDTAYFRKEMTSRALGEFDDESEVQSVFDANRQTTSRQDNAARRIRESMRQDAGFSRGVEAKMMGDFDMEDKFSAPPPGVNLYGNGKKNGPKGRSPRRGVIFFTKQRA